MLINDLVSIFHEEINHLHAPDIRVNVLGVLVSTIILLWQCAPVSQCE